MKKGERKSGENNSPSTSMSPVLSDTYLLSLSDKATNRKKTPFVLSDADRKSLVKMVETQREEAHAAKCTSRS